MGMEISVKAVEMLKKGTNINHHNKWLLYSSTVVLVSCLLVVDHISVVECGLSSAVSNSENETTGKSKEKAGIYGNVVGGGNSLSGNRRGSEKHSVGNNELHSTFSFTGIDEGEEDGDSYDDEDGSYAYDSDEEDLNATDKTFVDDFESHNGLFKKPRIGKCCPYGEGLNAQGDCRSINPEHLKHHDKIWFPREVYDGKTYSMVSTNISAWDIQVAHRMECGDDERLEIVSDMKKFTVLKDGSLYLLHHAKVYRPLDFCMEQELGKGEGRVVRACFSRKELCDGNHCLRKCCPQGSVFEEPHLKCKQAPHLTDLYHFENTSWNILASTPACEFGYYLTGLQGEYTIGNNGTFKALDVSAPFLNYCLDYFVNTDDKSANRIPELKIMLCFVQNESYAEGIDSKGLIVVPPSAGLVFGIAMIISAICLATAAIISWRLPELRSLHGKCQLSHLGTMFCFYVSLATTQLGTVNIPQGLCTFLGVFIHICSLSSFLWLNLLCVNIYLTFRSLRPPLAARRDENRRLLFLCVYAWGIPAAFCTFLYIIDSTSPGRLDPMPRPEYGELKCLISNREAEFAYLFGPVGVLLLCNGVLFCLTAQELLCGLWRLDNSDSINFRRKSMGIVVAKLGIVMGMGWILDVLSWAIGNNSPYMFYAVDLFNSLQGVFISVILLWRKRVLEVLHLRKPSMTKDETLTARPFLPKNSSIHITSNGDHDTSLVLVQDP